MICNKNWLTKFILLVFLIILNIYFRLYPAYFPQLREQAKHIVYRDLKYKIAQQIQHKIPHYDFLAKNKLFKLTLKNYKRMFRKEINEQINYLYSKLKDRYQDNQNQTYLMELDCWHYARYVENVLKHGHPADAIVNGKLLDKFMLAPTGFYMLFDNFLFYFSAYLYKIFSFFKYTPLFTFLFYLPLFFVALFIICLFAFSFRLGGWICAIFSCIFIGLFVPFLPRSCAGWFDKDILNLLFPLLTIWTYLESYEITSFKRTIIFVMLASFFVGVFCFTWPYWWFVFALIIIYEFIYILVLNFVSWWNKIDTARILKVHIIKLIAFVSFSSFWIVLFCRFKPFSMLYFQFRETIRLTNPLSVSIWPNVYATVGELKKTNLFEIVEMLGNFTFYSFLISTLILLFTSVFFTKKRGLKSESIIIFSLWFLVFFIATLKGIRFIVFLSIPMGIIFGLILNEIYNFLKDKKLTFMAIWFLSITIGVFGFASINSADLVAKNCFPLMTDSWYKFLTMLEKDTSTDAILNSWWDFGDWFKVVAKRRVIFDGHSQNTPQAYWMAKVLLNWNEKEALAILRMLNNGGNKAFELINKYLKDPLQSVLLLEKILGKDKHTVKKELSDYLPSSCVNKILFLLFGKPPPAYFIVDYSMIPKMSAISYLGNWNFSKVYIAINFDKKEKEKILDYLTNLGKNKDYISQLYQEAFLMEKNQFDNWISKPVQFYSQIIHGKREENILVFDNGFIYDIDEKKFYSHFGQIPISLFIVDNDEIKEILFENSNLPFSALIYADKGEKYNLILLDRQLGKSLFVRLYFLRGKTLKNFSPHIEVEDGKNYLGSYKILW